MLDWISQKIEAWYQRNTDYYIRAFSNYERNKLDTFNYAACLFPLSWFIYRKLYACFFICLFSSAAIIKLLDMIPFFKNGNISQFTVNIFMMIFCGRLGNRWYYKTVLSRIEKGYHLMEEYNPVSPIFLAILSSIPMVCAIFFKENSSVATGISIPLIPLIPLTSDYIKFHNKEAAKTITVSTSEISMYLNKANYKYLVIFVLIVALSQILPLFVFHF